MTTRLTTTAALVLALAACGVPPNPEEEAAEPVVPSATAGDPTPAEAPGEEPLRIASKAFDGIAVGVPLAEITDRVTEGTAEVDGIERDVHFLNSRGYGQVGFVMLDSGDERAVKSITVTSPEAQTARGLGVGATLATIESLHAGAEVEEVERGVAVAADGLTYLLHGASVDAIGDTSTVRAVVVE